MTMLITGLAVFVLETFFYAGECSEGEESCKIDLLFCLTSCRLKEW